MPAGLDALTFRERNALRALLIAAVVATGGPDPRPDLRVSVATAPIRALPAAADLHRLAGTVLRGLEGVEGVPDDVRQSLDASRVRSSLHHLMIVGALSQVADAFDAAGLPWVVMKGPVLSALLYPDAGDRSYADLDLLVGRRDFPRAMAILEDLGYRSSILNWALAERMVAGQIEMKVPAVSIDLHWDFFYSSEDRQPFALVPEEMLMRSRRVEAFGLSVPTFDPPDTLITLAVHAARSGGHRLLWLKDIERSITVDHPDLDEVVRRAHAYRCGPPVGIMLHRSKTVLGADVPDEILRALVPVVLRTADGLATRLGHPVPLHERDTGTRWLTRSMRSTGRLTLSAIPARVQGLAVKRIRPPAVNETDDPAEKASYLSAVSGSIPEPLRP